MEPSSEGHVICSLHAAELSGQGSVGLLDQRTQEADFHPLRVSALRMFCYFTLLARFLRVSGNSSEEELTFHTHLLRARVWAGRVLCSPGGKFQLRLVQVQRCPNMA